MPSLFPWTLNMTALDGGPTGLLQANMQALVNSWDTISKRTAREIDLLAFVPSWDRAIGRKRRKRSFEITIDPSNYPSYAHEVYAHPW